MTNRVNTVFIVLLMVLSVVASGLGSAPNTTQDELNENTPTPLFSGNNSSAMEWVQASPSTNNTFLSNSWVYIDWSAGELVTNITYNVTVDIYAHNATTNTTYVIWDDYSVFNATSNASAGIMEIPSATLPVGCYFASINLYDNTDGMHFDNDGFDLDIEMDCSGGSGNTTLPVVLLAHSPPSNSFLSNSTIQLNWMIGNMVGNITYNVTVDIYAYNATTNTTYVIWDDFAEYNNTPASTNGLSPTGMFYIPNGTLAAGCYYASFDLYDNADGMHFDNVGFDLDIEMDCSGSSGNNSGVMEWIEAWPESTNYTTEDIPIISWNASDLVTSITYNVTLDIYAHNATTNTTYVIYNDFTVFNATTNVEAGWWNIPNGTLPAGCYYASIGLYDNTDGMHFDNDGFDLGVETDCSGSSGNNTGGNNTGNTTDDCGTLDNLTDLMVWTDQAIYYEGDTVEGTFVTNCTVLNNTYILDYILFDSNNNSVSNNSANPWTWVANYVAESHTLNFTGLTADTYCLWAHLEDAFAAQSIDSDTYCFDVNEPTTAWGNGTARFIYIKPLSQNADQHTPFNLTFPAPPMADNSPYLSNMICSKADGHSADVWETHVPMPYNNITSWKVENTYGLVMGMFVMYDAQAAGIYSMQNPTVIFEQNLSFSGHSPSEIVDQVYFNCPMVTVSSTLSPVTTQNGSVLSYVAGISVNNSGDWTGDLNWEVATVTNGSSTALMDIGGHLLVESTGALLDHNFNTTGIVADEICLNWELIDESGVELSSGSECIVFTPISEPTCTVVTISNVDPEYAKGNSVVAWFNTELDCHGHAISYWVNSSTIGEAYSGIIDVDVNDPSSWSSTGTSETSTVKLFQTGDGGLIVDNHCITVQVSAYDAAGGAMSPYIDSDTVCFNVVTTPVEECTPWNNAECNTEFSCPPDLDKVSVEATDNVTGAAIEIWDCQETEETEESDEESGGLLPSVGVFGTLTASVFAVFVIALRRDEE